ncbi:DUF1311 domain-containing protein [Photobacterium kishitanii]|uniref:lysozyme inhibitor LprI family protein n=1 Tax=Photobacterium kishitanii TaxID=318456 RepID=UPI000D162582|nr:lysozyme inhibitor LprI family protein [Photobacterium kishitanii]PSU87550.1 DUF1311 domain-containing protein [Photobacterium kishitanii]
MSKVYLFFLLLICFKSIASNNPCDTENGGVIAGYNCVNNKIKIAEKKLDKSYKEALLRINDESPKLITEFNFAQKEWRKYKDAECDFIGKSATDSPWQGVQIKECQLNIILLRAKYIDSVYFG